VSANVQGVDLSAYQPNVDWGSVKAKGAEFAIIKVRILAYLPVAY